MPDVRGAKWVHAEGEGIEQESDSYGLDFRGNAWLVKESHGRVELVLMNGRRVVGLKASSTRDGDSSEITPIQIEPADLKADLELIATFYKRVKEGRKAQPNVADNISDVTDDFAGGTLNEIAGQLLLLLAQCQRAGRGKEVVNLLPTVLADTTPEEALSSAVTCLANARLEELTESYCKKGDATRFAEGLEKLAEQFNRGWGRRDGALFLAQRARETARGSEQKLPDDVAAAAAVLQGISRAKEGALTDENWLFPEFNAPQEQADDTEVALDVVKTEEGAEESAPLPASAPDASLAAFLRKGDKAARELAMLMDDHRLSRVLRDDSQTFDNPVFHHGSPEEDSRATYNQLTRPYEIGELALAILAPTFPKALRQKLGSVKPAQQKDLVLGWLDTIAGTSREELAWNFLAEGDEQGDSGVAGLLDFLVQKGGVESQKRLGQFFTDSAVWEDSSIEPLLPALGKYAKKLEGTERESFLRAVKAAARSGKEMYRASFSRYGDENSQKAIEARMAEELKQIDEVLAPRDLRTRLEEVLHASAEERTVVLAAIQRTVAQTDRPRAEAAVFQVAAKAEDPTLRRDILNCLIGFLIASPGNHRQAVQKAGAFPTDPETTQALEVILKDRRMPPKGSFLGASEQSVSDVASFFVVAPRMDDLQQAEYTALAEASPRLASSWLSGAAGALAAQKPLPDFPRAGKVSPEQRKQIVEELASKQPMELISVFQNRSPDEQVAVADYLKNLEPWPAPLVAAQKMIVRVQVLPEMSDEVRSERYVGRVLDAEVRRDMEQLAIAKAREEKALAVTIQSEGVLSGVALKAEPMEEPFPRAMASRFNLPDMEGRPAPDILVYCTVQTASLSEYPTGYGLPVWKDIALSNAWKEKNVPKSFKPTGPPSKPDVRHELQFDFEPAERAIASILANPKGAFILSFKASPLQDTAAQTSE